MTFDVIYFEIQLKSLTEPGLEHKTLNVCLPVLSSVSSSPKSHTRLSDRIEQTAIK